MISLKYLNIIFIFTNLLDQWQKLDVQSQMKCKQISVHQVLNDFSILGTHRPFTQLPRSTVVNWSALSLTVYKVPTGNWRLFLSLDLISLSLSFSLLLSIHLSLYLPLSISLFTYLYLTVCLFIYQSIYAHPFVS